MIRWLYIQLIWMHPPAFRHRFGDEMLGIFDESTEKWPLLADGFVSFFRQRFLRPQEAAPAVTPSPDGVPLFYSAPREFPSAVVLARGGFVAILVFSPVAFAITHRWHQPEMIVGSHHPSPSHILGVHTDSVPTEELPAEIKVKPYPPRIPVSPYFKLMPVLGALDTDQDNIISAAEIEDAPEALRRLDLDHDGKLSAEECGFKPEASFDPETLRWTRLAFMRFHPVLAALDANHDGVISAKEIRHAADSLRSLDANRDGVLTETELLPPKK
jgi:EF hand